MITYLAHMVWTGCMLDTVKSLFTSIVHKCASHSMIILWDMDLVPVRQF